MDLTVSLPHYHIRLHKQARADLAVWDTFLQDFNGKALFQQRKWTDSTTLDLYTDSAKSLGYGAIFGDRWFAGEWPPSWKLLDITLLELYPIVAAVHVWGQHLTNRRVIFHTDNQSLMHILNSSTSKDKKIMTLIRHLTQHCMKHNILFKSVHIPGIDNDIADSLSRFKFQEFRRLAPSAKHHPTPIPLSILPTHWSLG